MAGNNFPQQQDVMLELLAARQQPGFNALAGLTRGPSAAGMDPSVASLLGGAPSAAHARGSDPLAAYLSTLMRGNPPRMVSVLLLIMFGFAHCMLTHESILFPPADCRTTLALPPIVSMKRHYWQPLAPRIHVSCQARLPRSDASQVTKETTRRVWQYVFRGIVYMCMTVVIGLMCVHYMSG
jgi:hypothetical protein